MLNIARRCLAGLALAIAALAAAQPAEPLPYAAEVAARFPDPGYRPDTPAFRTGRSEFTSNAEMADALRALAVPGSAAPHTWVRMLPLGFSQGGNALNALLLSRDEPSAATAGARPLVLLVGQQHGDEPAGAEALLAVAQDLARGRLNGLLDRIDVVVMPRANPDGAFAGWRVGDNGLDINRDHLLLRTPEARAVAALMRQFTPALVIDAHEYLGVGRYIPRFGGIHRHDLLLQYATTANLPPALVQTSEQTYRQAVLAAMVREQLSVDWYHVASNGRTELTLAMGGVQADNFRNVAGLKNAISFLLETRGVGLGRTHLARRVHTQVTAIVALLQTAARQADELAELKRRADAEVAAQACSGNAVVLAATTPVAREITMLDPQTGADKAVAVNWESALQLRVLRSRPRACGYWLSADSAEAVRLLRAHGVRVQRFDAAAEVQGELYREVPRPEAERLDPRLNPPDAAGLVRLAVQLDAQRALAPTGSWYVPLDQPLANLVIAALEPDGPASFVAHRVIANLDRVRRVTARPTAVLGG